MNLTENEKRMVYQVESTCQAAILNEIAMNKRYAPNPEIRQTAESLLSKLRLLSDKECMALVNDVQKNYRLPGESPNHRGNACRGKAEVRGGETGRP